MDTIRLIPSDVIITDNFKSQLQKIDETFINNNNIDTRRYIAFFNYKILPRFFSNSPSLKTEQKAFRKIPFNLPTIIEIHQKVCENSNRFEIEVLLAYFNL